jgi:hypothetical protein
MRLALALAAAALIAAPTPAAGPDYLGRLLKGKTAESPRRCIFPDLTAQPEIIDGTALVYHDARYTYVARFKHGCPALREDRRVTVRGAGGQLCENDPVRVSETTGHDFGMCIFDTFVPYRKAGK